MLQAGVPDQALLVVLSDMTTIQFTPKADQEAILAAAKSVGPSRAIASELDRLGFDGPARGEVRAVGG
jgi:hypothetical protein